MNRKSALLAATHAAAIVAGVMLARPAHQPASPTDARPVDEPAKATAIVQPADPSPSPRRSARAPSQWRGSEYARAWKALRSAKLSPKERLRLQQELLKEWADIDLVAAIESALEESWDRDGAGYYDPTGPLLGVLSKALAKDPAASWDMIRGRQFGVATGMVRHVWLEAVGRSNPLFLAERIGDLSWRDREKALAACRMGVGDGTGPHSPHELFAVLSKLPAETISAQDLAGFADLHGDMMDPDQMKAEVLRLAGADERMATVHAIALGRQLAGSEPEVVKRMLQDLPDAARKEALWTAFRNGSLTAAGLEFAGLLIEEEAWDKLEQRDTTVRLQMMARNGSAKEVAEWATELPVRKETTELFHRSVDTYLQANLESAREWLATIPPGEWRDRAYAEYSQQALWSHQNVEASRWALDQIASTSFKREAEGWRSQWEQRTGWKAK